MYTKTAIDAETEVGEGMMHGNLEGRDETNGVHVVALPWSGERFFLLGNGLRTVGSAIHVR